MIRRPREQKKSDVPGGARGKRRQNNLSDALALKYVRTLPFSVRRKEKIITSYV